MAKDSFTFKQFAIVQKKAAMKVGVDGVMLGAWADVANAMRILDIGTGTGLIAIMLAQRNANANATVDAVEIDAEACEQAIENVENCKWTDRINVFCDKFQDFAHNTEQKYDLIVSNPPYFIASLTSPQTRRTVARHAELLSQDDLLDGIDKILSPNGKFCAIFPYIEANIFIAKAAAKLLYCNKKTNVKPKPNKATKRILLEFSRTKQQLIEENLFIEKSEQRHDYADDYKLLTKDFYLNF